MHRPLAAVERFFTGYAFPALAVAVLLLVEIATAALLSVPPSAGAAGAFAEQFRAWCFGAAPQTGATYALAVSSVFVELVGLMAIVVWFWRRPLAEVARERPKTLVPILGAATGVTACLAAALVALIAGTPLPVKPDVFQPQALRISVPAPEVWLVDHEGTKVRLAELKGRVVVLTAVYATCGLACPRILGQAKRVVARLPGVKSRDVVVLGVTLDPARDDVEELARMAEAQGVKAPQFRLLTGPPPAVEAVLDRMDVRRRRDEQTGVIDHANVFLLVDRAGRLAYRFTLDDLQERWMGEALELLVDEPAGAATAMRE
ncbi:MAG: SCO family protein [Archangiaceae bacterium]|nr:SCO family protein [Archangiaceae bacterium]